MDRPTDTYLIFGDDEYLVEEALSRVIGLLRGRHGEDLAVETVDYKDQGIGGLAEEIDSPSLFARNKVTVLKRFSLTSSGKTASEIEKYAASRLPEGQYLVMVPDRVDKRLRLARAVAGKGGMIECNHLSGEGLAAWILERFSEEGKTVSSDVAETLIDLKGEDLRAIDSEVAKAVTYAGDNRRITRKDIELLVGRSRTERVFELVTQVITRRTAEALEILSDLLDANESPIGIVYLLSQEVRRLLLIHLFLREADGRPGEDLGFGLFKTQVLPRYEAFTEAAGIPRKEASLNRKPYFLYMRFKECGGFALADLIDLMESLFEANTLLVSSSESPRVVLERVIAGMVSS
jgi:DNA polymerase-3 subunit delta